jgi:hypothetical protein
MAAWLRELCDRRGDYRRHRPRNVIGWILCAAGLAFALASFADDFGSTCRFAGHSGCPARW